MLREARDGMIETLFGAISIRAAVQLGWPFRDNEIRASEMAMQDSGSVSGTATMSNDNSSTLSTNKDRGRRVSPVAILLAIACSLSFSFILHYRKMAVSASEALQELNKEVVEARREVAYLRPQARLGDPKELPKMRDTQYGFVIDNYGFQYEGHTGDLIDEQILMYGLWEKGPAFFMRDYLINCGNERAVFVDVGCNVGHHSLFLAQYASQVHSFDPYLPALARFRSMIDRNKTKNIAVHEVGLGEDEAVVPYFAPHEGNFGSGTFNDKWGKGTDREELQLKIVRGDDWFTEKHIDGIELIKIDIEGYEASALRGIRETLESQRPVVFVEVSSGPQAAIQSFEDLQSLFPDSYEFIAVVEYIWTTRVDGKYITTPFAENEAAALFATTSQAMIAAYPIEKKDTIPQQLASSK